MTPKQKAFVAEYLIDLNATQAAIRAGYSARTAEVIGYENLRKPQIAAAVQGAMDKRANRLEITADRVLQEFAKVAFGNMLDYVTIDANGAARIDFSALTRDQASLISSIETEEWTEKEEGRVRKTKFRLYDKLNALVQLGRHLKIFEGEMDAGDRLDQLVAALKRAPYQPPARVN